MKDWTGNSKSIYTVLGASNHSEVEREKDDYYATDPKALEIFLNRIDEDGVRLHKNIWECACGEGHLSEVLKNRGYKVWSTDLIDRGYGSGNTDFLKSIPDSWCGDILTNPPYKYAKEFVEKALEVTRIGAYTVMFLKIQFLEGQGRRKLFKKHPPKYVYINSVRQTCYLNGDMSKKLSSAACYCWFVWEKGFIGEPIIRWI
ncbi:MAG: hypothetical protein SPL06_01800 [Bacteroidales bacterium]|nr:hypothetical protein [Bacteroidales bacterium]